MPASLQLFEGFAIGSAAVNSGLTIMKSFILGLIYSITTPVGIAVGEWRPACSACWQHFVACACVVVCFTCS